MSAIHGQDRTVEPSSLDALSRPRRRWIVDTLGDEGVLDVEELATRVTAWERDAPNDSVDEDDRQRTTVELLHVDLPALDEAGVVAYDRRERTVRETVTGDRDSVHGDGDTGDGCDGCVPGDLPAPVLDALADGRRRRALGILHERSSPLSVTDLACEIASLERSNAPEAVPEDYRHSVHVSLHHCHLPKLDDAGLVFYDEAAQEVERSTRLLDSVAGLLDNEAEPKADDRGPRRQGD